MSRMKISKNEVDNIKSIIKKNSNHDTPLIEILHEINNVYKCVPLIASKIISEALDISMSSVRSTCTFYDFFTEEPLGDTVIQVCEGASCVVSGAEELTSVLKKKLSLDEKHTTKDNKVSVEIVYCNGHCDKAPTMKINEKLYTDVDLFDMGAILKEHIE